MPCTSTIDGHAAYEHKDIRIVMKMDVLFHHGLQQDYRTRLIPMTR